MPAAAWSSVSVTVLDDDKRALIVHRTDNYNRAVPGGAMDLSETLAEAGAEGSS
jgi:ADP-ribose pyrophosphatase YjhB (NUDIX family)